MHVMGGRINCRFRELSQALGDQNLHYDSNVDLITNTHTQLYRIYLCNACAIFLLNHLYYDVTFDGDCTYFIAGCKITNLLHLHQH